MTGSKVIVVKISGMTCTGCSSRVRKLLEKHPDVTSADVSHETGLAMVTGTPSESELSEVVEKAGFKFEGIN